MKNSLPKILIISDFFFGENTGGGILLKNLFKDYPKEKIFIIHQDVNAKIDTSINSFSLKSKNKFNIFMKKILPSIILEFLIKIRSFFLLRKNQVTSSELLNRITKFEPDLIYTILGDYNLMCLIKDIKLKLDIPLVTHIMDNMLANFKNKDGKELAIFKYFIKNSKTRIAINSKMAEVFQKKFNCHFSVIHNGVDKNKIQSIKLSKETKVVTYIGSIFKNAQLNSLVEISKAINSINSKNEKIKALFYFPEDLKNLYESYFPKSKHLIIKHHNLNDLEYFKIICKSDLLILAANFDKKSVEYYKYSWPAKMGTYLMSKIPIFIYGPKDIYFVNNAIKKSWAYVESSESKLNLEKSLIKILNNFDLRKKIVKNALKISRDFDIKNIQSNFFKLLKQSVKK